MTNFLSSLSFEIIAHISNFTHSRTKRELSMVDLRINAVVLDQTKSLAIFPPSPFSPYKLSEIPDNILVNTIQRCPNLKKLIFCKNNNKEFTAHEIPYIENLILHLQINNKGLLGSIKKITCQEFRKDLIGGFDEARARKLNNLFLSTMSHKGLEKIKIKGDRKESLLTGTEIHSILVNSPHLTTFIFDVFDTKRKNMAFSFAQSPNLRKVKLLQWKGPFLP